MKLVDQTVKKLEIEINLTRLLYFNESAQNDFQIEKKNLVGRGPLYIIWLRPNLISGQIWFIIKTGRGTPISPKI